MPDALSWLSERGNQARFRRFVHARTGRWLDKNTPSRWVCGERRISPEAEALIQLLIERPDIMAPPEPAEWP